MNWREFRPTIFFLLKFLCLYLTGNLVYGLFVTAYEPEADPITKFVTQQTACVLSVANWPVEAIAHTAKATVSIVYQGRSIVSVYEGCNGVNVLVIFLSFLLSFGPLRMSLIWFAFLSTLLIHLSNLLRIALLFLVSIKLPDYVYFTHKYLFTAFIYAIVFVLWIFWVRKFSVNANYEK